MWVKKVKVLLILLVIFIGLVDFVKNEDDIKKPSVKLKKEEYSNFLETGKQRIDDLTRNLLKNQKFNAYLQGGLEILDNYIEKCIKSTFKKKSFTIDHMNFRTRGNPVLQKVMFKRFWIDSQMFASQIEINVPSLTFIGKYESDIETQGNNFESKIDIKNMKVTMKFKGQKISGKNQNPIDIEYSCSPKLKITKIETEYDFASGVINEVNIDKKIHKDLFPFNKAAKNCLKKYMETYMNDELKNWCEHYLGNHILNPEDGDQNVKFVAYMNRKFWETKKAE